jgi:hypothetical protein
MPEKEVTSRILLLQKGKHNFLHFLWQYFWWKKSCIFSNYFMILMKLCFFVVHIHVKKKDVMLAMLPGAKKHLGQAQDSV